MRHWPALSGLKELEKTTLWLGFMVCPAPVKPKDLSWPSGSLTAAKTPFSANVMGYWPKSLSLKSALMESPTCGTTGP